MFARYVLILENNVLHTVQDNLELEFLPISLAGSLGGQSGCVARAGIEDRMGLSIKHPRLYKF